MLFLFKILGRRSRVLHLWRFSIHTDNTMRIKRNLTRCPYHVLSKRKDHIAVHDMVRLMASVNNNQAKVSLRKAHTNISSRFLRDSKNSRRQLLGGQKTRAGIWTNWHMKTSFTLSLGARETTIRKQLEVGSQRARPYLNDDQKTRFFGSGKQSRTCDSKMSSQAIVQFCRATELDRDSSKIDSGSGTPGPTHPRLRRHGQDRNPGGPLQSGRTTMIYNFYKGVRLQKMALPL